MAENLQPPRGTADLLPAEMARHRRVVDASRRLAARFGFKEMATPVFEFTDVFARPLGEGSDVVTKETYTFTDRGGESLTLRPEGTAGIVRALISGGLAQTLPQKFFYSGPMFRYERPQKGRMRQFHQIGVELLGPTQPLADAEVVHLGAMVLGELGIAGSCALHLNSLGDAESRQAYRAALVSHLDGRKGDLSEDSLRRLETNPLRILDSKDEGDRAVLEGAPALDAYLNDPSKEHFDRVCSFLDAKGVAFRLDPGLVRGLDYYCHTAFEFITGALGAQGTVLGGGRYDGLAETLGGPAVAGVGWAAGIERLAMLLEEDARPEPPLAMIAVGADHEVRVAALAGTLREAGIRVEMIYSGNLGKQMKRADQLGASFAAILGGAEMERGVLLFRDMKTGEQEEIGLDGAAEALAGKLAPARP